MSKNTGKVIGIAGIDRQENGDFELGYYIDEVYRRQGYAYEACETILEMREELGAPEVTIRIKEDNVASLKLAEKLGLKF